MEPCQETSGFLFAHRCGRPGTMRCSQCGKRICIQHARPSVGDLFLCILCAAQDQGESEADVDGEDWDSAEGDPYFYSARYRAHSGEEPDPLDFTEGDQGILEHGAGGAFEDDMGGS